MIWPAIWVNAQAGVMGGKYQKLFWSIKEKYDLTSAVWSEFEVVSEFFLKNMYVFHESEIFLPTEKPLTIMMLLGLYSRFLIRIYFLIMLILCMCLCYGYVCMSAVFSKDQRPRILWSWSCNRLWGAQCGCW